MFHVGRGQTAVLGGPVLLSKFPNLSNLMDLLSIRAPDATCASWRKISANETRCTWTLARLVQSPVAGSCDAFQMSPAPDAQQGPWVSYHGAQAHWRRDSRTCDLSRVRFWPPNHVQQDVFHMKWVPERSYRGRQASWRCIAPHPMRH